MAVPENLTTRYQHFYMAKLAQQAERYDEAVKFMEKVVAASTSAAGGELNLEERNLLFMAYKNVISSLRAAWQTVEGRKNEDHVALLNDYKSKVETELSEVCTRVLNLLETHLIPSASTSESKIFYLKMKGDYHRYLAEFKVGTERNEAAENTMVAYNDAEEIAVAELAPTHPTRLGLANNISVFYYEILHESEKACSMAREAYEEAMAKLDTLAKKKSYEDSTVIMQLLRDNLTLWTSDIEVSSYYD